MSVIIIISVNFTIVYMYLFFENNIEKLKRVLLNNVVACGKLAEMNIVV